MNNETQPEKANVKTGGGEIPASSWKLDITKDHCPMTFVKVKLQLARMKTGEKLDVRLLEGEPLENVPRSAEEQGFKVLQIKPLGDKTHLITIEK